MVDEAMAATLAGEPQRLDTVAYTCCDMMVSCSMAGDLERAVQWCRHADAFIDLYGCPFLYARCRISYGILLMVVGDWVEAEAQLTAAVRLAASGGRSVQREATPRSRALRTRQGRVTEARTLLAEATTDPATAAPWPAVTLPRAARPRPWPSWSGGCGRVAGRGTTSPSFSSCWSRATVRPVTSRRPGTWQRRLTIIAAGTTHVLPRAYAPRSQAQVFVADGDPDSAVPWLEEAMGLFDRLDRPWELARTRLQLARAIARTRRRSPSAEARAALETFEALGAAADADATAAFLRALGKPGRRQPRSHALLTRRQQDVLELLAQGLSNPEIARRLYVSPKTAAHHVSAVLAKLGVSRRAELVALAARQSVQSLSGPEEAGKP